MSRRSPVILSEQIDRLGHVCDPHIAVDDRLQRRKLLNTRIDPARTICAEQNRVFDHQAAVLDRGGGGMTNKAFALEVASREARNFPNILDALSAGELKGSFERRRGGVGWSDCASRRQTTTEANPARTDVERGSAENTPRAK